MPLPVPLKMLKIVKTPKMPCIWSKSQAPSDVILPIPTHHPKSRESILPPWIWASHFRLCQLITLTGPDQFLQTSISQSGNQQTGQWSPGCCYSVARGQKWGTSGAGEGFILPDIGLEEHHCTSSSLGRMATLLCWRSISYPCRRQFEVQDYAPTPNGYSCGPQTQLLTCVFSPHPPILLEAMNEWQWYMVFNMAAFQGSPMANNQVSFTKVWYLRPSRTIWEIYGGASAGSLVYIISSILYILSCYVVVLTLAPLFRQFCPSH